MAFQHTNLAREFSLWMLCMCIGISTLILSNLSDLSSKQVVISHLKGASQPYSVQWFWNLISLEVWLTRQKSWLSYRQKAITISKIHIIINYQSMTPKSRPKKCISYQPKTIRVWFTKREQRPWKADQKILVYRSRQDLRGCQRRPRQQVATYCQ